MSTSISTITAADRRAIRIGFSSAEELLGQIPAELLPTATEVLNSDQADRWIEAERSIVRWTPDGQRAPASQDTWVASLIELAVAQQQRDEQARQHEDTMRRYRFDQVLGREVPGFQVAQVPVPIRPGRMVGAQTSALGLAAVNVVLSEQLTAEDVEAARRWLIGQGLPLQQPARSRGLRRK